MRVITFVTLNKREVDNIKVYGSISELVAKEKIVINNQVRSESWLRKVMQERDVFYNDDYFIKRVEVERKKQ